MLLLLALVVTGCVKQDENKTLKIVSTKEVTNDGRIIVEATFEDATRMFFRIISATEAEVTYANMFYFEDESDWKYEGDVVIPEEFTHFGQTYRVVGISGGAFNACEGLTSVEIPETVNKYIYGGAFAECSELVRVKMPSHIEEIDDAAFYGCKKLTSITLPEGMKTIYNYTFQGCESLASINVPNSVETIGLMAFAFCKNLTSVEMPSVYSLASGAFTSCENLKEINMPAMKHINRTSFGNCTNLQSIELPETLVELTDYAFRDCTSLTSVTCHATTPPVTNYPPQASDNPFLGCPLQEIKVPSTSVDAYKSAWGWSQFADIIVGF